MNTALNEQVGGKHYKHLVIQPADCESSVIWYVTRHREKNGKQDLEKAIHCLQLLIELEYSDDTNRAD